MKKLIRFIIAVFATPVVVLTTILFSLSTVGSNDCNLEDCGGGSS